MLTVMYQLLMFVKRHEFNSANVFTILQAVKGQSSEKIEGETVEFKEYSSQKALHNDSDLPGEISALSNCKGGMIIIGVRDGSMIKNQDWPRQLQGFEQTDTDSVYERLRGKLQNSVDIRVENISFESKNYLAIFVQQHRTSLVMTTSGKAYIREARSSRPMSPEEIERAVKSLQHYDWSADVVSDADDSDLCTDSVSKAYEQYCMTRGLVGNRPTIDGFLESIEAKKNGHITKGGLLFVGSKDSIKKYIGDIEFRFSWKVGVTLKNNQVWSDNLWNTIEKAKGFFDSCVTSMELLYHGNTYHVPNLDPDAFHEAFLNAIAHRDYAVNGMVTIEFSGGSLQISSPGQFYGGIRPDNIYYHEPRHRNKALTRILMEYKFVDRAGMGITRMGLKSLVYGRRFPEFEEQQNSVRVIMQAEFIRPGIFVLTRERTELHIPDLVILNSLYEKGYLSVLEVKDLIQKMAANPWGAIDKFIERWTQFAELCGTKEGIFIRVKEDSKALFEIQKVFKTPQNTDKYIKLFQFLKKHGTATSEEIAEYLDYNHRSTTSRFLGELEWVERTGKSIATKWGLSRAYL